MATISFDDLIPPQNRGPGPWDDYKPRAGNPFDQFDAPSAGNPFDRFDAAPAPVHGPWEDYGPAPVKTISFEDLIPARQSPAADVVKSAGAGLGSGALDTAMLLPRVIDAASGFGHRALDSLLGAPNVRPPEAVTNPAAAVNQGVRAALPGLDYAPQTTAGRYAKTAGEFVPGAMVTPGNALANALRLGVIPGVASEAAGQATEGTAAEPLARLAGALLGPSLANIPGKIISPMTIAPERQAMVDALKNAGVDLTAGQTTGNKGLQWAESALSDMPFAGNGYQNAIEKQGQQFTAGALAHMGIPASERELATPEVLAQGKANIGQQFNDLASRNTLQIDPQLRQELAAIKSDYADAYLPSMQRPIVNKVIDDLAGEGAAMPGSRYQDIRSRLSQQAKSLNQNDPQTAQAVRGIRDALDNAMLRSVSPDDAAAWNEARNHWANWKTIEKAAGGAGSESAMGYISPAALRNAAASGNINRGAYVTGQNDLGNFARDAVGIMNRLPQSGTAPRQNIAHLTQALASVGAGGFLGGVPGAVGAVAGPAVAGRVLMSGPVQAYLKNQVAQRSGLVSKVPARQRALAAALGAYNSSPHRAAKGVTGVR